MLPSNFAIMRSLLMLCFYNRDFGIVLSFLPHLCWSLGATGAVEQLHAMFTKDKADHRRNASVFYISKMTTIAHELELQRSVFEAKSRSVVWICQDLVGAPGLEKRVGRRAVGTRVKASQMQCLPWYHSLKE